jgi:hypothetical protein
VRFMITSTRPEFAEQIWPLIANSTQKFTSPRCEPRTAFGPRFSAGASVRMTEVPSDTRANILAEIAMRSGIDGIEFAITVAKNDPSGGVRLRLSVRTRPGRNYAWQDCNRSAAWRPDVINRSFMLPG